MLKQLKYIIAGLCMMLPVLAQAQGSRVVKGTVTDENGDPLPGVVVMVTGTSLGTSTDIDGKYSINISGNQTLEFSCIGYTTKTVPVGSQSVVDVKMEEDSFLLEETVVVGYGT